jgi:hypothetical protein
MSWREVAIPVGEPGRAIGSIPIGEGGNVGRYLPRQAEMQAGRGGQGRGVGAVRRECGCEVVERWR